MACQKVRKEGSDDIIMRVNLQSLIPALFPHLVCNCNVEDVGIGLCKFTFTITNSEGKFTKPSLPCLHTFWHAVPTSFEILNVF